MVRLEPLTQCGNVLEAHNWQVAFHLCHDNQVDASPRPLSPFVDLLPVPPRRVIEAPTRLTVTMQAVTHRFHRDLPPSRVWAYDGHLPGPTIEVARGTAPFVVMPRELMPFMLRHRPSKRSSATTGAGYAPPPLE